MRGSRVAGSGNSTVRRAAHERVRCGLFKLSLHLRQCPVKRTIQQALVFGTVVNGDSVPKF